MRSFESRWQLQAEITCYWLTPCPQKMPLLAAIAPVKVATFFLRLVGMPLLGAVRASSLCRRTLYLIVLGH